MVAAGNFRVSGAFETNTCGMGFGVFAGRGQHESSDDGEVYARRAAGASEPGPRRALFGWKRHAPGPVGKFLRDLRCVGGGLRSPGPFLMLATAIERHLGKKVRVARLGSGAPVILLHGYPDNLQIWSELAPMLATQFEVIAFDLPGMGNSEASPAGATPFDMAKRVLALYNGWGVPP